jgi:hypothetical protein
VTLAPTLALGVGQRIGFVVTIEGWPYALWSAGNGFALAGGQVPLYGILDEDGIQESPTSLDFGQRMQVGGGLALRLRDHALQLQPLIAPRRQRITYLAGAITRTATSIPVKNAAALPSSGVVFIGGETITYGGKSGNTLTSAVRGAYGSEARAANGGSQAGRAVYTTPPVWSGRRLTLQGYLLDGYEQPIPGTLTNLGVFRLEGAPREVGDGTWELQAGHLLSELAGLKLGRGLRWYDTDGIMIWETASGQGLWRLRLGFDPLPFTLGDAPIYAHAVLRLRGAWDGIEPATVLRVFDLPLLDDLRMYEQPLTTRNGQQYRLEDIINESALQGGVIAEAIKPISVLAGGPAYLLTLHALCSRYGDGDNGTFDVLPGAPSATFGAPTFQVGAGLRAAEVDAASFAAVSDVVRPGWSWVIDEETPAVDLLRDFLRAADAFVSYSLDGKLTARKMSRDRRSIVATLTRDDFVDGIVETEYREDLISPRVRLVVSYDPLTEQDRAKIEIAEEELVELYPHQQEQLVIRDRSMVLSPVNDAPPGALIRPTVPLEEAATLLRREQGAYRRGRLVVSGVLPPRWCELDLGEHVQLALPSVPDYQGGTLTSARGRIVGRGPQWQAGGLVSVQIEVLPADFYLAPSAIVASVSGSGPWDVTLQTTDDGTGTATPGRLWRVGDRVAIDAFSASTTTVFDVFGVTDTVIGVSGQTAPTVGHVVMLFDHAQAGAGLSADGFGRDQFAYLQGDDEGASPFISRWI